MTPDSIVGVRAPDDCVHPDFRLQCSVPHCRRWRGHRKNDSIRPGMAWICQRHWMLVSPTWRRRIALFRRRERYDLAHKLWLRGLAQAIERSAGITG